MSGNAATLSAEDRLLFDAIWNNHDDTAAADVQQLLRDGANVNAEYCDSTPLMEASQRGRNQIIRILLDAGADARWRSPNGQLSPIFAPCFYGNLPTLQLLLNHDNGLLEIVNNSGETPLFRTVYQVNSDIIRFLLDSGANAHHITQSGDTVLMKACLHGHLDNARMLLAAGVDVEARNRRQETALHHASGNHLGSGVNIELVRELILQHNANMFAVDIYGRTPFDMACCYSWSGNAAANPLLEKYGNKLTQDDGRFALHELLNVAEYSFFEDRYFHPPLNPLRIILPLGKLTMKHLRTLLHTFDPELIRTRDGTGKLPIHIACRKIAPVEVLALILELDSATLHIADSTGALPIHLLCGATGATEYASVRYLVEQGGVGTLAARNRQGLLPLHVLCGSTDPPLRAVQYLIQSFPGSVALQTNGGQYPFMVAAAADSSSASLSVIYELVRASPGVVVPR